MANYIRTVERNPWLRNRTPHPKQRVFLLLDAEREVLYGGAARGGKSDALLMAAAQYLSVPGYAALLLRRNFTHLVQPDGLIPRSQEWWASTDARWNAQERQWTFPCPGGGVSVIKFGYCDSPNDVYQYQGSQYAFVGWDELTHFVETQYTYLFSRQSRPTSGPLSRVPLRMRGGANPGGVGHDWVKRRFVDPKTRFPGALFVSAKVKDNLTVDQASYVDSLSYLDPLTRQQLLDGNWDAVEGGRYRPEWFAHRYQQRGDYLVLRRPGEENERTYRWQECERFVTCDPAASEKTTADYTVAGVWLRTPLNELLLLDLIRFQAQIPDIVPRIEALWEKWLRPSGVWIEAVAANSGVYQIAARTRMPAGPLPTLGQGKLVRATQAINYAHAGRIWLPAPGVRPGMPLDEVESELYRFTGDDKMDDHDDVVDVFSYAARVLGDAPSGATAAESLPRILGGYR